MELVPWVRAAILTEANTGKEIRKSLHGLSPFQKLVYIHLETCKGVRGGVSLSFTPPFEEVVQTEMVFLS